MSNDPSPWASIMPTKQDDYVASTEELILQGDADRKEEEREALMNEWLWKNLAARLTADGGLTR